MILVVSHAPDVHAQAVMGELAALGADAHLLDLAAFPQQASLTVRGGPGGRSYAVRNGTGPGLDLGAVQAVWWRRPQPFALHPELARGRHHAFAYNECHEAWAGVWHSLREDARWVNDLARDELAHRKVYQLRVAQDVGLTIPETLITTDPAEARAFLAGRAPGTTIFKAFSALPNAWRETRLVTDAELAALDHVRYAPTVFQEYVEADFDARITVVGDEVFPAAIYSQETAYRVDFRMDMDRARMEPVELPGDVRDKLLAFMRHLGLVYGAIDMRRRPNGEWVFLEVNPAGQFLFVEQATGQPIARTIARYLVEG